ncbi:MAG TPA: GNAT family N-acetyltransferase [Candidatus Kapabacteria bacterium]|nr:GNAT family N-acetyltransferase [Candidatus Kapabacteria bacterium]
MKPSPRIELIDDPDSDLLESVNGELRRHNQSANPAFWALRDEPEHEARPLNLFAFAADGEVVGGLFGSTCFSWLMVNIMATKAEHRGTGIGRALLARAEEIARERGCRYAYVDTMEYQAPRFYAAAGYRIAGTLDDWDSHGHRKFLFVKDLV